MGVLGLLNHLLNFVLPALALALLMPLCVRWTAMGRAAGTGLLAQILLLAVVNSTVLVAGLFVFGRDGKMLTYLSMALACASAQWLLCKAWRP